MSYVARYFIQDCIDAECPRYYEVPSEEGGFYPCCKNQGDLHDGHFCRFLDGEL